LNKKFCSRLRGACPALETALREARKK